MSSLEEELGLPEAASLTGEAKLSTQSATIEINGATSKHERVVLVGRQAATADLRIQHGSISRKHAALYYLHGELYLKDLGGKHGTMVNGNNVVDSIVLQHGDKIQFGNVRESIFTVSIDNKTSRKSHTGEGSNSVDQSVTAVSDQQVMAQAGEGLTGREKRQAEIEAMMASLDQVPVYTKPPEVVVQDVQEQQSVDEKRAKKYKLPVTDRLVLPDESDRKTTCTCLSVDPAGARFAVGSTDSVLRFYDFGGIDQRNMSPFKSIIVEDGYWATSCCYSNTGDKVLVGTGGLQPIVFDREGDKLLKFQRGDMYVIDQSKTVGHTAAISQVDWHPLERDLVLTGSADGSARLWDLTGKQHFDMLVCKKVFSVKNQRGQRTAVKSICFHPAGREFALGTVCGSIQIWSVARVSARPERMVLEAHGPNKPVTALSYSYDGNKLASRSVDDDTIKVWNPQRLSRSSTPTVTCNNAATIYESANMAFSPDAKVLCAGVTNKTSLHGKSVEAGSLVFFDISKSKIAVQPVLSLDVLDSGITMIRWHAKINQIFVACANNATVVFFDETLSSRGALRAASKSGRKVDDLAELLRSKAPKGYTPATGEIFNPFATVRKGETRTKILKDKYEDSDDPLRSRTKKRKKHESDAKPTMEPERPATLKHKKGSQAGGSVNLQQFVADQSSNESRKMAGKDPREALFKFNEGKSFVERAYKGKSELASRTAEEEEEESQKR